MSPSIKYYIKAFVISAIVFGCLLTASSLLRNQESDLLIIGIQVVVFSAIMSFVFLKMQINALKDLGIEQINDHNLSTKQVRVVPSKLSKEEVATRLKNHGFGTRNIKTTDKGLDISSKLNIKSFGERIMIQEVVSGSNEKSFRVASKPKVPFVIADYGRNLENVRRIERIISSPTR